MTERQHKPTIAAAGWLQYTIQDHLEPLLDAARSQLSDLNHMRSCMTCLHMFDGADQRAYVNDEARDAYCPACNIEATPSMARAALAKALEMNPEL